MLDMDWQMDWQEFQHTMEALEGRALAESIDVHRPGPGTLPGIHDQGTGVLQRKHPSEWEEFWWTLPEAVYFDLVPHHRFWVSRAKFRGSWWEQQTFVIHRDVYDTRLTLLAPGDGPRPSPAPPVRLRL